MLREAALAAGTAARTSYMVSRRGPLRRLLSSAAPRILVVDGYAREGRAELASANATPAGELYAKMLKRWAPAPVEVDICYPSDGPVDAETAPARLAAEYAGVAWTGCNRTIMDGVSGRDERVAAQIELQRRVFASGVPSFGSCWALQVAVVAAGGACARRRTGASRASGARTPHAGGRARTRCSRASRACSTRRRRISTRSTRRRSARTRRCSRARGWSSVQAAEVRAPALGAGVFWGVQYHPEFDLRELAALTKARREKFVKIGLFRDMAEADAHVADLEALYAEPIRRDLRWKLGIDDDILDDRTREIEAINWLAHVLRA